MIQLRPYKIRNTTWRRICLAIGMPVAVIAVAPLTALMLPFRVLWNMAKQAWWAAGDEWSETFETYPMRLLRTGFWWAWQPDFHTDSDAALKRAKDKVHDRPDA